MSAPATAGTTGPAPEPTPAPAPTAIGPLAGRSRTASHVVPARHWRWTQPALVLTLGAVVLWGVRPGPFDLRVWTLVVAYAVGAVGFNVLIGYAGALSIGNAVFLAIGGYAWAKLAVPAGPAVALLTGIALAAGSALLLGLLLLRLRTFYFAIGTLALGTLGTVVTRNWTSMTNGDAGLVNVGYLKLFGQSGVASIFATGVVALAFFCYLQEALRTSPWGLAMAVSRYDPPAAQALGVSVSRARVTAFVFSGITAAVAGALIAQLAGGAFPDQFGPTQSTSLLIIPILGGRGWRWAPIVGAMIVIALPEHLRFLDDYRLVVYGVAVTAVALFLPGGVHQIAQWVTQAVRNRAGTTRAGTRRADG